MKNHRQPRYMRRYSFDNINARTVEEISMQMLYFPRTVSLLIVTLTITFYFVIGRNAENFERNIEAGFYCTVAFFLVVSVLAFPNGPYTRPHPVVWIVVIFICFNTAPVFAKVWRVVFGVSVLYLLCLSFATCLHIDQIKAVLYWVDPTVKYAKREIDVVEAYAVNCSSITVERIYSAFDIFAFGHFVGWAVKTLSIRSYIICWAISILWEFTEIFFMDIFPNFQECWWDQVVMDILVCNAAGIWVGMRLCKFMQFRRYRWESIKDIHTTSGKLRRAMMQFTPSDWMEANWIGPGSNTRRILGVYAVLFGFLLSELNTFFLKHFLRFPASHPFCWVRLVLLAITAAPTCRQFYVYMTDVTCNRLGTQAWVFLATLGLESIVSIKIGCNEFTRTVTAKIVAWFFLTMIMALVSLFGLVYVCKTRPEKDGKYIYDSPDDSCWEKTDKSE